jgi:hypothetical protein
MLIAKWDKWQFVVKTLMLGMLSSRSVLSFLVGALFKKFGHFWNMPFIHTVLQRLRCTAAWMVQSKI